MWRTRQPRCTCSSGTQRSPRRRRIPARRGSPLRSPHSQSTLRSSTFRQHKLCKPLSQFDPRRNLQRTGCTFRLLQRLSGTVLPRSRGKRAVLAGLWLFRRRSRYKRRFRFRWRDCRPRNPSKLRFQCWLQSSQLHSPRRSSARWTQSLPSISQFRSQRKRPGQIARCTFQLGRSHRWIPPWQRRCRSTSQLDSLCKQALQSQNKFRRRSLCKRSLLLQNRSRRHSPSKRSLLLQNMSRRRSLSKRSLLLQNRSRCRSLCKRSLLLQNTSRRRSLSKWIPPWQRRCRSTSQLDKSHMRSPSKLQSRSRHRSRCKYLTWRNLKIFLFFSVLVMF